MNSYDFPLGTDHLDYDATRVDADLRALPASARARSNRPARHGLSGLLGSARRHLPLHGTSAHTH